MSNTPQKKDGPACACGRGDLYENWKTLNENREEKTAGKTDPVQDNDPAGTGESPDNMMTKTSKDQ
jgi:hypothetical protein